MGSDPEQDPVRVQQTHHSKEADEAGRTSAAYSEHAKDEQTLKARKAAEREHDLSWRESLRLYPKAIAFSLLFSSAIIMEGYDLALIGGFYGYTA